ncbi:hypothetical protein V6N13_092295 [Hibiscus sabdariffa]|uniref:Uncharacterized protein n=1 Tax=Hibiscus sabdariffa TaxID=183260 RepID=A0ABR2CCF3_9ROSI
MADLVGCNYPNTQYELHMEQEFQAWNLHIHGFQTISYPSAQIPHTTTRVRLVEFLKPYEEILLSGWQSDETSADMNPIESCGKAYRALSNVIQMVLKDNSG